MTRQDDIESDWGGSTRRPSLLIADDSEAVRSMLIAHLGSEFEIVALGTDATEASALAEQHQPDLALLDVEMPGGGAREAVKQIAERSPRTCMVILSANESHQAVVELLQAGAMAYVIKGASPGELVKTLVDSLRAQEQLPPT